MVWNIFKREPPKKEAPAKRRPFLYDTEKMDNMIELYAEASDLLFKQVRKTK